MSNLIKTTDMKYLTISLFTLVCLISFSCKEKETNASTPQAKEEILKLEEETKILDQEIKSIEATEAELDQLLNEIEK